MSTENTTTKIPCVMNVTPFPKTVRADNNEIFIPPYRAIRKVRDKNGKVRPYRMYDFMGIGFKDMTRQQASQGQRSPMPKIAIDDIPTSRLQMIASNNAGLIYVETDADISSRMAGECVRRSNEVKELINTYIKSRQEMQARNSYVLPEDQDINKRTGKPYMQSYLEELAVLQSKINEWQANGFPTIADVLDAEDSPELQAAVREAKHIEVETKQQEMLKEAMQTIQELRKLIDEKVPHVVAPEKPRKIKKAPKKNMSPEARAAAGKRLAEARAKMKQLREAQAQDTPVTEDTQA